MEIQKMGRGSKFGACESPDQRGLLEEGTPNGNGAGVTSIKVPLPHLILVRPHFATVPPLSFPFYLCFDLLQGRELADEKEPFHQKFSKLPSGIFVFTRSL